MKDRNSTLLRAFINEVQETGVFNHPAMMDIVKQHKQEKLAPQSLPLDNEQNNQSLPQNNEPDSNKIINFEDKKKEDKNDSSLENIMIANESFSPSSSNTIENQEVSNFSDNQSTINHQQSSLNPSDLPPFNPHYSEEENKRQDISQPLNQTIENPQETPQPRKKDRNQIILQNYLEYVRKTGDCEYPPLEKYLVNLGLIKQR